MHTADNVAMATNTLDKICSLDLLNSVLGMQECDRNLHICEVFRNEKMKKSKYLTFL